jgi:hypothetical protein
VCGRVTKSDGSPLARARVFVSELRDQSLPPKTAFDPNLSRPDGSFCVEHAFPGRYLLMAVARARDSDIRWVGYYPGVLNRSEAELIEVKAGVGLADLQFKTRQQQLYSVRFRIVASDGKSVPSENLGISIRNPEREPLGYQVSHEVLEDGSYTLYRIPPGRYIASTYIQPDFRTLKIPEGLSDWRMAEREVEITADGEVLLTISSPNAK